MVGRKTLWSTTMICDSIPIHSVKISEPLLTTSKITGGEGILKDQLTSSKCIVINKVLRPKAQLINFYHSHIGKYYSTRRLVCKMNLNSEFLVTSLTRQTESHSLPNKIYLWFGPQLSIIYVHFLLDNLSKIISTEKSQ